MIEHINSGTVLYDPASSHYNNEICNLPHQAKVVRNQKVRESVRLLQVYEQIQNLGLRDQIQARKRFIENEKFRLQGQGARNRQTLPLSAAKLQARSVRPSADNPTSSINSQVRERSAGPEARR